MLRDPVVEPAPVVAAEQDDGELGDLLGLHQRERLEQLVQRAEAAREAHERLRVLHEHRLAGEEVAEVDAEVDPVVEALLERQLDAEPDREPARLRAAPVRRLHHARPAAGDHGVAGVGQRRAQRPPGRVLGVVARGAGRAEHGDRAGHLGQRAEPLHELGLDPQHPPRVGVHPVARAAGVEQPLVGRGGLVATLAPEHHRSALLLVGRALPPVRTHGFSVMTPRDHVRNRRSTATASTMRRTSTCSSRVCARFGSPGP